ncbi:MAG TPA: asparagine synthase (glutamine-hydrolyzing) [Herpetosiphonaceae bacterium]|nr:asparagine synthase (glutamine-hydrolyzing) [Herpetosiphonaceae bacterium]
MCGITGLLNRRGQPVAQSMLDDQMDAIRHRGPDGAGSLVDGAAAIGMRRLAIIDLAGGAQPVFSQDGALALVFNGEIYNYRELRRELRGRGRSFETASDTEVLMRGIEEWGLPECLRRLNGMFAFAVWDSAARRLTLVRDRLGIKPLYVYSDDEWLIFGSEIKAILRHPQVPRQIDPRGLANFLAFGHALAPRTMLRGIRKLPPGHLLEWQAGTDEIRETRYWDVALAQSARPDAAGAAAECYERLREAVRLQLVSDVPLGAFLSGGLDSSIIVGLMTRLGASPVRTFSVGFEAPGAFNELADARLVARHFGTEHHELKIGAANLSAALRTLVYHFDEPFGDAAALPLYLIAAFARQHVTVALTGEGSDEQWGGYRRYQAELLATTYRQLPGQHAVAALIRALPRSRRLKQAVAALGVADPARRYAAWLTVAHAGQRRDLLQADIAAALGDYDPASIYDAVYPGNGTPTLTSLGYADLMTWLPDTYLEKVDKATMAASLEARVPFLDHTLVEWAMSLPPRLKLRGRTTKWLLRQAFADLLPPATLRKPKHGFAVPTDPWFRGPLRQWTAEILFDERTVRRGLFNPSAVRRVYDDHVSGRHVADTLLWLLLNLELWQRVYLDREGTL